MNSPLASWQLWAVLSAALAALTAISAKDRGRECQLGLRDLYSNGRDLIRSCRDRNQHAPVATARVRCHTHLRFLGLSGLATGASWLCYFRALQLGDAALVAPIDKLSVVLVALFAVLFLGERLSGLNWLGIGFIAGGTVLIAYKG